MKNGGAGMKGFLKGFIFQVMMLFAILTFISVTCQASQDAPETPPKGVPAATNPPVGPPGSPEKPASKIEEMGYGDYKGVIHAHSYLSHDSWGTPARVIQAAKTAGIDFILMTDHPSPYSVNHGLTGFHGGILFLPGAEITRDGGNFLGLDLKENVAAKDRQGVIDETHAQGGIAALSHLEDFPDFNIERFDGMEIYNTHYDAILDGKIDKTIALVPLLSKDPDRVWLSILDKPTYYLKIWDEILKKQRATGFAANDSHENVIYNGYQLDTYERSYGLVSTHLFLMELNEAGVLDAFKKGHAYVCFDVFGACRGFSLTATDGKTVAIMGDEFTLDPKTPSKLDVSVPDDAKIQLLKDGAVIQETTGKTLSIDLKEKGVYRVEAYKSKGKKNLQWIFSNPIYVR
ncbi:MAG TPA: CehA/McbA family metallohydrolase [bacterium]|nr:CehA/McbA family metallohydrolase [bacterium]